MTIDVRAETNGSPVGPAKKRKPRRFGWEFKVREAHKRSRGWRAFHDWTVGYVWYETAARRDAAVLTLNRKEPLFEYRPLDREHG